MSDSLVLSLDSDTPVDSSQTAAATARKLETTLEMFRLLSSLLFPCLCCSLVIVAFFNSDKPARGT